MEVIWNLIVEYGWQAVVIALFTFLSIEGIKPIARKYIKKDNARHTLYVGCNYVFTLAWSFVLALILKDTSNTFQIFAPAMVVVNVLGPVISNLGFWNWIEGVVEEFVGKITDRNIWKKGLKELVANFGIDASILEGVAKNIENEYSEVIPDIKENSEEFFKNNETAEDNFVANIKQKLAGFVSKEKLDDASKQLFDKLFASWKGKKAEKKEEKVEEVKNEAK